MGGEADSQRRPHGDGVLLLADGAQHLGHFSAGRADGLGFYLTPKGLVFHGSWRQNARVGNFISISPKGETFHELYGEDGKRLSRKRAVDVHISSREGADLPTGGASVVREERPAI